MPTAQVGKPIVFRSIEEWREHYGIKAPEDAGFNPWLQDLGVPDVPEKQTVAEIVDELLQVPEFSLWHQG